MLVNCLCKLQYCGVLRVNTTVRFQRYIVAHCTVPILQALPPCSAEWKDRQQEDAAIDPGHSPAVHSEHRSRLFCVRGRQGPGSFL